MIALLTLAALASDGVEALSLDEVLQYSKVVAVVEPAEPDHRVVAIEVPLSDGRDPFRFEQRVDRLKVVEVVRGEAAVGDVLDVVQTGAHTHFDRSLRYEVEGTSKGMIHLRYETSLAWDARPQRFVVFLSPPVEVSDDPWSTAVGPVWTEWGRDDVKLLKKLQRKADHSP